MYSRDFDWSNTVLKMVDVITNNLERIIEACKKMQVESLYLFGSGTNEKKFGSDSDLDFLFRFRKNE